MTNPHAAIRTLIVYAICIPLALLVGWMITNPLDYGTLGFFGLIAMLLSAPFLIRWHYPLMVFGLGSPIYCFFLKGNPPLAQVVVILSLGIAIVERTINSDRRFRSPAVMTWPMFYTVVMVYLTAQLTGGIGLRALGGDTGGGKKYIALFIGCATFFALTSRYIPREKRTLYVVLLFLSGLPQFVSDLFPYLPSPLNYINLLIPPSGGAIDTGFSSHILRLGALGSSAGCFANFMIARYGLRGIFLSGRPLRIVLFFAFLSLTFIGGFRVVFISYLMMCTMLFFLEGLYRTRFLLVAIFGMIVAGTLLVPFARHLPMPFQRALSVLPLTLDPIARVDAEASKQWREDLWRDTWPKVPQHLLLGKGYALSQEDFLYMGRGAFEGLGAGLDASQQGLAISGDYHNGPLSTLMPFGIWGAISFLWVVLAALFILYRNYRYGDPELKTVNALLLVMVIQRFFGYFFIFGAYSGDIGEYAKLAGFSVALNWGICAAKRQAAVDPHIVKPLLQPGSHSRPLPVSSQA